MKAQTPTRIAQLKAQWPVIEEMLRLLNGHGAQKWPHGPEKDHLYIEVKRADENLVMYQPFLIDGIGRTTVEFSDERKGQAGTTHEAICGVSTAHDILATIGYWDASRRYLANDRERVRDLFRLAAMNHAESECDLRRLTKDNYEPTPAPQINYIVRVNVVCWYKEIKDYYKQGLESSLGEFVDREIHFTVYRAPTKGFGRLLNESDPALNIRLNINDIMTAMSRQDDTYNEALKQIDEFKDRFIAEVYTRGLQTAIIDCDKRGMSGVYGETKIMTYVMAGSIMLTFTRGDDDVTFIGADDKKDTRLGLQSINATLPAAREMVEQVIREWGDGSRAALDRFRPDKKVSIL
jgi:hypothetical protein